jgi:ectoine hydroxylase-related dioxygenase (phytanoyl-CoA dioxygenase family)
MNDYYLLCNTDGHLLCGETTSVMAGDHAMWSLDGLALRNASGASLRLESEPVMSGSAQPCRLTGKAEDFVLVPGPTKLPTQHLAELRTNGFTVLENVLDQLAIARIKQLVMENRLRNHADESSHDGHFWMMGSLAWSADVARAASHPVALWLLRQYMQTEDIHYCHQPIITTLKPAKELKGQFPEQGWHNDYPYHPGIFPEDYWPAEPVYGLQYNVCVDSFETGNAATQFVPGSHEKCHRPPVEMNTGGTHAGVGAHKDVQQMLAPPGAALLYDSRTWHRACHELNLSGRDRIAILNAVAPAWVTPMIDKTPVKERYQASEIPESLTIRERAEIALLCNCPTMDTPQGMPLLKNRGKPKKHETILHCIIELTGHTSPLVSAQE